MTYKIVFERRAAKAMGEIPKAQRANIYAKLDELTADPRTMRNVKRLQGSDVYRLRVGDFRVIYALDHEAVVVVVVDVGNRREVYRDR